MMKIVHKLRLQPIMWEGRKEGIQQTVLQVLWRPMLRN